MGSLTGTTIDRVDVLVLRHALSGTRYFSTGSNVTRDSLVVRMSNHASRVGWGETYLVPGAVAAARALTAGLPGLTPMPTDDLATYARLAGELDIPIAGGESVETFDAASAAVAADAYDIIQPDASICGGLGTLLDIAAMASARGVGCVPHACNGAISLAATLQVLSVLSVDGPQPGGVPPMLEHDVGENPLRSDLLRDPLTVRDGWLAIPAGPGLGVEVDEAAVSRFAIPWP